MISKQKRRKAKFSKQNYEQKNHSQVYVYTNQKVCYQALRLCQQGNCIQTVPDILENNITIPTFSPIFWNIFKNPDSVDTMPIYFNGELVRWPTFKAQITFSSSKIALFHKKRLFSDKKYFHMSQTCKNDPGLLLSPYSYCHQNIFIVCESTQMRLKFP